VMVGIMLVRGIASPSSTAGWGSLLALVGISTVIPIFTFYAGMQKVGAPRAAILSTVEPMITVLLAVVVRHETLAVLQVIGGALILLSVIVLQTQRLQRLRLDVAPSPIGD